MGVVDIGSNSVRFVIYDGLTRAPTPVFNEKVLCGLGKSVASTGHLGGKSVECAIRALTRFHAIARNLGVKSIKAIATAAVREAVDGAEFIRRGQQELGAPIEVLSGEKEAILAAKGIMMGIVGADGVAGDLGGGSLELIDLAGDKLNEATTLPLGGLRLIDTTRSKVDKAETFAGQSFDDVPWLKLGKGRPFYAVGGTWRALAKMYMERTDYPLRVMHGFSMPIPVAISFCESIVKAKKLSALPGASEVSKARRDVLPYGAAVMLQLLKKMQPSEVIFSIFGVREGLLYSLMSAEERRRDPLFASCETYARLRSRSVEHAFELCNWTDALFGEGGPDETPAERRLRHAACLLSDIGWRAHPDYRGEQSMNIIAHAGLGGVDHPGLMFLALSVYFRHAGASEAKGEHLSERFKRLVSKRSLNRARIVGAAVRTAHMLSIGMPGVIDMTPLSYDGDRLVLSIPPAFAGLEGERLQRRFGVLATLLGKTPEIRKIR
ncbi:MAG: Ppx/GppA family phosphatase [Hyphomicrobiaceae bacterium]|nr:Ppx/GppA family phosphatase [Hyphomicrobiaceae bacterium]MCC0007285.1 Ppx/GppA family phosphatase [Hyphomicrobiaceae bacterium]